jgi:hypothetical protein
MATNRSTRLELLQGTLDMMVMRTLSGGAANGYEIAKGSSVYPTMCWKWSASKPAIAAVMISGVSFCDMSYLRFIAFCMSSCQAGLCYLN